MSSLARSLLDLRALPRGALTNHLILAIATRLIADGVISRGAA